MRTAMLMILLLTMALVTVAPTASAGPNCVQVYPWSELCNGDVGAVVCYYAPEGIIPPEKCDDLILR